MRTAKIDEIWCLINIFLYSLQNEMGISCESSTSKILLVVKNRLKSVNLYAVHREWQARSNVMTGLLTRRSPLGWKPTEPCTFFTATATCLVCLSPLSSSPCVSFLYFLNFKQLTALSIYFFFLFQRCFLNFIRSFTLSNEPCRFAFFFIVCRKNENEIRKIKQPRTATVCDSSMSLHS